MQVQDTPLQRAALYAAMERRDPEFDGLFVVAVRTTGIYCRPVCPATCPREENCLFFSTAQQARAAGFRACRRCHPDLPPAAATDSVRRLLAAVESDPARRWRDADLASLGLHPSTARRQFRRRFGMTFLEYTRAQRLGQALHGIQRGRRVIDAQLDAGYESASAFRDAFVRAFGSSPGRRTARPLMIDWLDTPIGPLVIVGDERAVCRIDFADHATVAAMLERLRERSGASLIPGRAAAVERMEAELSAYFRGERVAFSVPLEPGGTQFQNAVWNALLEIPFGETRSYTDIARTIGQPQAVRAVARANGANPLVVVVPCHRVVNSDGRPGGYGGGLPRKLWLLGHERHHAGAQD